MPEGDAVLRTARRLHAALAGAPITTWDLRWPSVATSDQRGAVTVEVVARGKHLLHRLDRGITLHTHLRMDGSWWVRAPGPPVRDPWARAVVGAPGAVAVGRRLGLVELVRTSDEHRVVGHLGPDLLDPDFDADEALARLRSTPQRPLGETLLDQRVMAGLGTMWASEALHAAALGPLTTVADADARDRLGALVGDARTILVAAVDGPGRSTYRVRARAGAPPPAEHRVYGKAGRPCPRCGATVRSVEVGQAPTARTLQWCPRCQV